jgi:predicted GNAT family N-acyltransferase
MHAQTSAATFYDRLGWRRVGPLFSEAGIWHVAMRKDAP